MRKLSLVLALVFFAATGCGGGSGIRDNGSGGQTAFGTPHKASVVPPQTCSASPSTIHAGVRGQVIERACPGTVCGKPDSPVDGGVVSVFRQIEPIATTRTACGAFAIELSPGTYTLKAAWGTGSGCPAKDVSVKKNTVSAVLISC